MTHGAGVQELQVEYEVVELHPQVAADARVEASRRQAGTVDFGGFGWELLDQDSTSLGNFFLNGNWTAYAESCPGPSRRAWFPP